MMNRNSFPSQNLHLLLHRRCRRTHMTADVLFHNVSPLTQIVPWDISHRLNNPSFLFVTGCRVGRIEYGVHRNTNNFINSAAVARH